MKLRNVIFPRREDEDEDGGGVGQPRRWNVELVDGVVRAIAPAAADGCDNGNDSGSCSSGKKKKKRADANVASRLLLPPLCHPHLHLDKAYILTSGGCSGSGSGSGSGCYGGSGGDEQEKDRLPSYDDLLPRTGDFAEALRTTAAAKARFTAADLRRRGAQLLATSWRQGVTAARVFVEVDAGAAGGGRVALEAAAALRRDFAGRVAVQICAFAQEAVFTDSHGGAANRAAMEAVLADPVLSRDIAVLGSAPYVEGSRALALRNLDWAVETALVHGLHLDLHLDYNLDDPGDGDDDPDGDHSSEHSRTPLLYALLDALDRHQWCARSCGRDETGSGRTGRTGRSRRMRTIAVGHATQLTRLPAARLRRLADDVRRRGLPVHLVGLPTSDVYMMGRGAESEMTGTNVPRGTLNVPALLRQGLLPACLGVNNVGNAFTPHGTGDPLQLACWGVGLYHAGTPADARRLYGAVSWGARAAIGDEDDEDDDRSEEEKAEWSEKEEKSEIIERSEEKKRENERSEEEKKESEQSEEKKRESERSEDKKNKKTPWWDVEEPSQLLGRRIGPVLVLTNERYMRLADEGEDEDEDDKNDEKERQDSLPALPPVPARARTGFRDVVWDPPDVSMRRIV